MENFSQMHSFLLYIPSVTTVIIYTQSVAINIMGLFEKFRSFRPHYSTWATVACIH